ncbi:hypothetical protein KCU85_g224, partial [Aureobasidium melanogenum]
LVHECQPPLSAHAPPFPASGSLDSILYHVLPAMGSSLMGRTIAYPTIIHARLSRQLTSSHDLGYSTELLNKGGEASKAAKGESEEEMSSATLNPLGTVCRRPKSGTWPRNSRCQCDIRFSVLRGIGGSGEEDPLPSGTPLYTSPWPVSREHLDPETDEQTLDHQIHWQSRIDPSPMIVPEFNHRGSLCVSLKSFSSGPKAVEDRPILSGPKMTVVRVHFEISLEQDVWPQLEPDVVAVQNENQIVFLADGLQPLHDRMSVVPYAKVQVFRVRGIHVVRYTIHGGVMVEGLPGKSALTFQASSPF